MRTDDGEGFGFGDLIPWFIVLACIGALTFIFLPVNLSHVAGYPFAPGAWMKPRNLLREAEKKLVEGSGSVSFTEEEVNAYLHQRLKASQRGPLSLVSDVEGIFVDLENNSATLYFVQRFLGFPFVISSSWNYYLADMKYVHECTGSSVGRLRFKGVLLRPLMMPFRQLVNTCRAEATLLNREGIDRVRLEPGLLKLEINRQ